MAAFQFDTKNIYDPYLKALENMAQGFSNLGDKAMAKKEAKRQREFSAEQSGLERTSREGLAEKERKLMEYLKSLDIEATGKEKALDRGITVSEGEAGRGIDEQRLAEMIRQFDLGRTDTAEAGAADIDMDQKRLNETIRQFDLGRQDTAEQKGKPLIPEWQQLGYPSFEEWRKDMMAGKGDPADADPELGVLYGSILGELFDSLSKTAEVNLFDETGMQKPLRDLSEPEKEAVVRQWVNFTAGNPQEDELMKMFIATVYPEAPVEDLPTQDTTITDPEKRKSWWVLDIIAWIANLKESVIQQALRPNAQKEPPLASSHDAPPLASAHGTTTGAQKAVEQYQKQYGITP